MARVLYLCVHDKNYPRNSLIRDYLISSGHEVVIQDREPLPSYVRTSAKLIISGFQQQGPFDIVILSELALQYAVPGKAVALRHGAKYWVDAFVGMYESNIEDWGEVSRHSPRAFLYRFFDLLAYRIADLSLIDTVTRGSALTKRGARTVCVIPVGAPQWAQPTPLPPGPTLEVLYYGNYIPLHGLDYIADGLAYIMHADRIRVTFIGNGALRPAAETTIREKAGRVAVQFLDSVTPDELGSFLDRSHVVFGVFGRSPKAGSVLANKLWQGLAAGRTVINRSSVALEELIPLVGDQLISVNPEQPQELAKALDHLAEKLLDEDLSFKNNRQALDVYVKSGLSALGSHILRG